MITATNVSSLSPNLTTVSLEKWCRLRGNLLFYFKTADQFSEPQGCIVLEKYRCAKHGDQKEYDGYVFYLGKIVDLRSS